MEADLAPLTVVPRGFGGSTMADVLHYVDRLVLPYKPRAVVIYEGDNDTFSGVSPETIVTQLRAIISKIHAALPDTCVYVLAVKPSLARVKVWDRAQETDRPLQGACRRRRPTALHRRRHSPVEGGWHGDGRRLCGRWPPPQRQGQPHLGNGDQVDLDGDRSRVRDGESQRTVNGWEGSPQTGSSF